MHHPDFYFQLTAGTMFIGTSDDTDDGFPGRPLQKGEEMLGYRPWARQGSEGFEDSKICPSVPDWDYAAAAELQSAIAIKFGGKTFAQVRVEDVERFYQSKHTDSHHVFEGHLPPMCPFAYVDRIFLPSPDLEHCALTALEKEALGALVDPSRIVTCSGGEGATSTASFPHIVAPTPLRPQGFLWGANAPEGGNGARAPIAVPLRLPGTGTAHIYFRARGPAFSIVLLSHPIGTCSSQHFISVETSKPGAARDGGRAVCTPVAPGAYEALQQQLDRVSLAPRAAQPPPSLADFNVGIYGDSKDMAGSYHLAFTHATGELVLKHSGVSLVHNKRELRATLGAAKGAALQWFGLVPLRGSLKMGHWGGGVR